MEKSLIFLENNKDIKISKRSLLYSLEPIGKGTAYIESINSYICRLATAHNITVSSLLTEIIYPELSIYPSLKNSRKLIRVPFVGKTPIEIVRILEFLTSRNDLNQLTLLNWSPLINVNTIVPSLFKKWCPNCIHEWSINNETIYEPILWQLNDVNFCPIHNLKLQSECYKCNKTIPYLSSNMQLGFCPHCGTFLGQWINNSKEDGLVLAEKEKNISKLYSELLILNSTLTSFLTKASIKNFFYRLKDQNKEFSFELLSRILPYSTTNIRRWLNGMNTPPLDFWASMCGLLGTSFYSLLTNDHESIKLRYLYNYEKRRGGNQLRLGTEEKMIIKEILIDYLSNSEEVLSFKSLIKKYNLKYTTVTNLYPELKSAIVKKHKEYVLKERELKIENQKELLNKALLDKRMEHLSLKMILENYKIQYKFAKKYFPDLLVKIQQRYEEYVMKIKREKIIAIEEEIKRVMYELHNQGIEPTINKVNLGVSNPIIFKNPHFREYRKKIKEELGY